VQKSDSAFQFFNRQQQKARPSDPALGVAFVVALAVPARCFQAEPVSKSRSYPSVLFFGRKSIQKVSKPAGFRLKNSVIKTLLLTCGKKGA